MMIEIQIHNNWFPIQCQRCALQVIFQFLHLLSLSKQNVAGLVFMEVQQLGLHTGLNILDASLNADHTGSQPGQVILVDDGAHANTAIGHFMFTIIEKCLMGISRLILEIRPPPTLPWVTFSPLLKPLVVPTEVFILISLFLFNS